MDDLPAGVGLACFPGVPITVPARIIDCSCDPGPFGGWIEPGWLWDGGARLLLVDPSVDRPPADQSEWLAWHDRGSFWLHLDPTGAYPDPLPVGGSVGEVGADAWAEPDLIVDVTGMFDHPAAADCSVRGGEPAPVLFPAILGCQLEFAITRVARVGP